MNFARMQLCDLGLGCERGCDENLYVTRLSRGIEFPPHPHQTMSVRSEVRSISKASTDSLAGFYRCIGASESPIVVDELGEDVIQSEVP